MQTEKRQASIVGSSFQTGADRWIARLKAGQQLRLEREPTNRYDRNAISVWTFQQCLGYIPRGLAAELAPLIDAGFRCIATKSGDPRFANTGVILLEWDKPDAPSADEGTD